MKRSIGHGIIISTSQATFPRDCWPVGGAAGHWYGGGESGAAAWPLDTANTVTMAPFVTGDADTRWGYLHRSIDNIYNILVLSNVWGNLIRKFFISSLGLSVSVADESPLSVSLQPGEAGQRELCLEVNFERDCNLYYYRLYNIYYQGEL